MSEAIFIAQNEQQEEVLCQEKSFCEVRTVLFEDAFYIQNKNSAGFRRNHCFVGGAEGDRTLDLSIANAALSQLSYGPPLGCGW